MKELKNTLYLKSMKRKPSAPEKVQVENAENINKTPSRHEMMDTECVEPNSNNPLTTSPNTLVEKASYREGVIHSPCFSPLKQ